MANYPKMIITNNGLDLIGESMSANKALIFTKAQLGDGMLPDGTSISSLETLIHQTMQLPLSSGKYESGRVRLRFVVDNANLDQGFFAREVGIFAKCGEAGTEQLYAYTNGGNYVDYIPNKDNPIDEEIMDVYVVTGNAPEVKVVAESMIYATQKDLLDHIGDPGLHCFEYDEAGDIMPRE